MPHTGDLKGFLIFLAAAGIIVPFFHRARIGTVLGFLLVGVALGPFGLGRLVETYPWLWYLTFDQPERAQPAAELGIIFLLFLLGLELSLQLGARVLEALGLPEEAVAQRIEEARDAEVGRLEHRSE